jgi:hypothetical protein
MAAEQLQIKVAADVQQAISGLNSFNKQLQVTGNSAEILGAKSIEVLNNQLLRLQKIASNPNLSSEQYQRLGKLINDTSKDVDRLTKSLQTINGANGLPGFAKGANTANTSMINLGRTVSDAPFGFIGIANNIGPLVENFTQLRKESGTTGGALKALGSSLAGPGGVIVGIQLVVAAVQFAQLGFSRWGASSKKAKEDTDKLKQANEALVETVSKQRLEFETLVKVAKDVNQTEVARAQALKRLNEILPDTIGKLNKQNIATKEGEDAIRRYIDAVNAKATAELLSGRIAANNVQIFDLEQKSLKEIADLNKEIEKNTKLRKSLEGSGRLEQEAITQKKIFDAEKEIVNIKKDTAKEIAKINELNSTLVKQYEKQIPVVNTLNDKVVKGASKQKTLQEKINDLAEDYKITIKELDYEQQITGLNKSNQRLNTNFDFLKRIAILGGETSKAYAEIASKTQGLADAASKFKIDELIKNYQTAISELDLRQAVTGQDQLNQRINQTTDALIKLKQLGVSDTNQEFIKLNNTLNALKNEVALKEIRKRTEEITKTWERFQLQVDKLNFNKTKEPLDALKSKIDLIGNAIQELKSKGLTDADLGIQLLTIQFEQLGKQFEKLKEQKEILDNIKNTIESGLTNAFGSVFEAVASGEDAFKALGDSVKKLLVDLLKVIIQMTIVKAIANAIAPGLGGNAVDLGFSVRGDYLRKTTFLRGGNFG